MEPESNLPPSPKGEARRADAGTLNEVYLSLLGRLVLSPLHRQVLTERGLTDDTIDRAGYRTLPVQGRARLVRELRQRFGDTLLRVPGFVIKESTSGRYLTLRGPAGLLLPCRDRSGRIVALKVRCDDRGEGRPRYVYVSSSGHGGPSSGAPVHVPLGTPPTAELVRLTEGELQADVLLARTGLPTLSAPGVGNRRATLTVLKELACQTVRLALDADAWDNAAAAGALSACAAFLSDARFAVELERWDAADGKGLDDLLVAGKVPEVLQGDAVWQTVQEMVAAASAEQEAAPPDDLHRLHEVLATGGAEALFRDKPLMRALADLAGADPAAFAAIRASIRERVSVRDLDRALRSFPRRPVLADRDDAPAYFEEGGCICRNVQTKEGPVPVRLGNFSARITEDIVHDDGAEQTRTLALQGTLMDGTPLPRTEIAAADFAGMDWIVPAWGTRAVVGAGMGTRDHLRAALQLLSGDVLRRTVYRHLGWRKVGDAWLYLHGGGAIGAAGLDEEVPVVLPEPLAGFQLPVLPEGTNLIEAVRASLQLLDLGPDRATFPLLAAVYRAVLGDTDFAIHLAGPTGCYKSEAAALAQQHFGAAMHARHLPANWSSTGNALEGLAFTAKDAVLVVDDFCPTGTAADVQRYHREADRLFRGQGNRAGRQRMRADASLRPAKPPRGLILSTGEDVPRGQSLRARLLVVEISPGDLGPPPPHPNPALSERQRQAAAGQYAGALSGFIRWLAPQLDAIHGRWRHELAELRDRARGDGQHARTPGIIADLALGLRYLLAFARSMGAVSEVEQARLWERGWAALAETGTAQLAQIAVAEPAGQFLRLLSAALAGGYAHVADQDGNEPAEPQRWGWRPEDFYAGDGIATRHKPQGVRVGWLVDGELYLEPEASFAAVQCFARDQNESFPITAHTLRRRLKEKGLLATTDAGRGKLMVRKTLQGARRDVLHIAGKVTPLGSETGPIGAEEGTSAADGPQARAGNGESSAEPAPERPQKPAGNGRLGRLGRSDAWEEERREGFLESAQVGPYGARL